MRASVQSLHCLSQVWDVTKMPAVLYTALCWLKFAQVNLNRAYRAKFKTVGFCEACAKLKGKLWVFMSSI